MANAADAVTYTSADRIATITINRADRMNRIDADVVEGLHHAWQRLMGSEDDRVNTLGLGADDYLVKPFSMRELVARVSAAARRGVRSQPTERGQEIQVEELRIDPVSVQAYLDGRSAGLTPTEFRLLYALAAQSPRVVTRDELLQQIWGRRLTRRDRTVDVFIRKLREKIDAPAPRHAFVHTRYGVGYKLEPQPK